MDDLKKEDANESYKEHLGQNVHVTVKQGYDLVDIRKWWLPEKADMIVAMWKGISLPVAMWKELMIKKTVPVIRKRKRFQKELDSIRYCYLDHNNRMSLLECPSCNPDGFMNY